MDIFAHALFANLAVEVLRRRKKKTVTRKERVHTIIGGIAPDLVAFLPAFLVGGIGIIAYALERFSQEWGQQIPYSADPALPAFLETVYSTSHSGLLWLSVVLISYLIIRRVPLLLLGWGVHIGLDIFTHDAAHFPTKLLFPFSHWHINATSWSDPVVVGCTYAVLLVCYLAVYKPRPQTKLCRTQH